MVGLKQGLTAALCIANTDATANTPFARRYAVSADGQLFLVVSGSNAPAAGGDSIPARLPSDGGQVG